MKKYLLLFCMIITVAYSSTTVVFSYNFHNAQSEKAYNLFFKKLSARSIEKQKKIIEQLHAILLKIKERDTLSSAQLWLISDLLHLNTQKKRILNIKIRAVSEIDKKENTQNNIDKYSTQEALDWFPIIPSFNHVSSDENHIFLKDDIWYTYLFTQYSYFDDGASIQLRDLKHNWVDISQDLAFVTKEWKLWFTKDYSQIELAHHDTIEGHPNMYDILLALRKDQTKIISDTKTSLQNIQDITEQITAGKNTDQKIQTIYHYILEQISYTINLDLNDRKIFSWIETFNNRDGVCEGYTALFYYMLQFAGIDDVEVMYGDVIDSADFPNIGHAWVRIWDEYYDPTFDDPVWASETKKFVDYKYYKLPKDIFYTNRYNYWNTPESLKTTSLQYRKNLIQKNLSTLVEKYSNQWYTLMKPLEFKSQFWYQYDEIIRPENYSNIAPIYNVANYVYQNEEEDSFNIKKLQYFPIAHQTSDLGQILEQINYQTDDYTLFYWQLDDGSHEYRMAYNIEYY